MLAGVGACNHRTQTRSVLPREGDSRESREERGGGVVSCDPPDPVGLFSEGGEVIKLHVEGSLTIPRAGI